MNATVEACQGRVWHLHVWDPENPAGTSQHLPWACRSWRCQGECRRWKGAQDFARIAQAMEEREHWSYIVLGFAQADWKCVFDQYKAGLGMWAKLRKRFTRRWGKFAYIQTWERYQKGGAHLNLVVSSKALFEAIWQDYRPTRNLWLEPNAVACGFGYRTWLEPVIGEEGMAGYLGKLSRELTGAQNKSQVPDDAPHHFRRIRASRYTLPPTTHSELTGRIVFCNLEAWNKCSTTRPKP